MKSSLPRRAKLRIIHPGDYSVTKLVPSVANIVTELLTFLVKYAVLPTETRVNNMANGLMTLSSAVLVYCFSLRVKTSGLVAITQAATMTATLHAFFFLPFTLGHNGCASSVPTPIDATGLCIAFAVEPASFMPHVEQMRTTCTYGLSSFLLTCHVTHHMSDLLYALISCASRCGYELL